jgi:3-oxoadipate enol-lactonase
MPFATSKNISLYYQLEGHQDAPVLMLANSLGTTLEMWEPQISILLTQFQVLRYDVRGHGRSGTPPGPYTIEQLGQDALALLDHLGLKRVDFCGLSMGGMTGMWLGTHHPQRIRRLVLSNTAAKVGTPELWNSRLAVLGRDGMAGLTASILERWFTRRFQERAPHVIEHIRAMLLGAAVQGYAACVGAIRDMDQLRDIARIDVSTLVIAGRHDVSTPPELAREITLRISGSRYVELDAAHLSNWEQAGAFTVALMDFLNDDGP